MAISYNPNTIDSDLILYLDAANIRSYPGTGTSWIDLSSRNNNASMSNLSFSIENLGGMSFNGSNSSATIEFNAINMDFSSAQTICIWMKPGAGASNARRNPYNQAYGGPGTLTHEPNGTINYYFGTNGGNNLPYVGINSTFIVAVDELTFISVARDQASNVCKWYKNGALASTQNAGGYASTANGNSPILIGNGYAGRFIGSIFSCQVYNRALSDSDIRQNFNATRGRFGV